MFQMKEEPQDTEFVSYSPTKKRSKRKSVPDDLTMEETSDLGPQIVKRKSWRHLKNISTRPGYAIPKEKQNAKLQSLTRPHIDSFNWFLHKGAYVSSCLVIFRLHILYGKENYSMARVFF